jgi:hypothetical protein
VIYNCRCQFSVKILSSFYSSSMAIESPLSSPKKCEPVLATGDGTSVGTDIPLVTSAADSVVSNLQPSQACDYLPGMMKVSDLQVPVHGPAPRYVNPEELNVLQTCLTRWRTEVEQDVKGE